MSSLQQSGMTLSLRMNMVMSHLLRKSWLGEYLCNLVGEREGINILRTMETQEPTLARKPTSTSNVMGLILLKLSRKKRE